MSQPELVCNHCQTTNEEIARLRADVATAKHLMGAENTSLAEELAGARATQRTLEGQLRAARAENTKLREEGPNAERVKLVLNCWVQGCGTVRADVSMSSDRAALVFKMLKHRNCGAKNVEEQTMMLCRAVKGVALKPYKLFNDRHTIKPADARAKRLTRLEHCIGNDDRVEENVAVYRNACKSAAELRTSIHQLWQQASALESELCHLVTLPLALYEQGKEAADIEEFLWTHVAARGEQWDEIMAMSDPPSNVVPIRPEVAA